MTRFEELPPDADRQSKPLTFTDLIDRVDSDAPLSATRRLDLKSTITGFCKRLHVEPSATIASMDYVRKRIEGAHPAQIGLKAKRWQNILSDIRFAIDRFSHKPVSRLRAVDLPAPWRALLGRLPPWTAFRPVPLHQVLRPFRNRSGKDRCRYDHRL